MKDTEPDSFHLGVKALIFNEEGLVLLLERDHPIKKRYWDIPGGRVQKGESLMHTLAREVQEETGLSGLEKIQFFTMALTDIRIPIEKDSVGLIFSIFHCQLSTTFEPHLSQEHINFGWFAPEGVSEKLRIHYPIEFIKKFEEITSCNCL